MTAQEVSVSFRSGVRAETISSHSIALIKLLGALSNNGSITVSSAARSPYDQARVMFDNCLKLGIKSQYKLYARAGDKVIKVFESETKKPGYKVAAVIEKMEARIREIGPNKVSKHCADFNSLNVVDIPFSSIGNKDDFRKIINEYVPDPVKRFLDETSNNCFHLEIDQSTVENHINEF